VLYSSAQESFQRKEQENFGLTDMSIATDMKVIKEPTLEENMFIYAVNDVAQRGIDIAQSDARVKQILDEFKSKEAAVTIAAVQPAVMANKESGELFHSSAGQVILHQTGKRLMERFIQSQRAPARLQTK
jgi:hypothetical protein